MTDHSCARERKITCLQNFEGERCAVREGRKKEIG
jgi:hypothetical protein